MSHKYSWNLLRRKLQMTPLAPEFCATLVPLGAAAKQQMKILMTIILSNVCRCIFTCHCLLYMLLAQFVPFPVSCKSLN